MKKTNTSEPESKKSRIEWTGAGGDYFLGIVVDANDQVLDEFWGTRHDLLAWMKERWPRLRRNYVPMVYAMGAAEQHQQGKGKRKVKVRGCAAD